MRKKRFENLLIENANTNCIIKKSGKQVAAFRLHGKYLMAHFQIFKFAHFQIKLVIALIITAVYAHACANNNQPAAVKDNIIKDTMAKAPAPAVPDSFATGKVIDTVVCKGDATQSYALYIPAKGNAASLPVVYCFDSHGSGSLPLRKYKTLADTYGFILVGSNNSKNGNDWPLTQSICFTLLDDTKKRLPVNTNRMYTCGFSGGAKVASSVAINDPEIKGVIANGAGLPDGTPAGNFNFSFTAVAGEGDMNMTDLVAMNSELDKTRTRHRIIFFNGKHEWAPEKTMDIAFAGWQLDAMYEKLIPKNDAFINNYIAKSKKTVEGYYKINQLVKAARECTLSASMLDGLTDDVNWFKQKGASLAGNVAYQQQLQAQQKLLTTEQNMKEQYMQQFQQGDMNYWAKTISDLQAKAKASTAEGAMYQRLLAYLSLAFYSFSNRFINSNQNNEAQYVVQLYKMADPTNSEAWYFSAILDARDNRAQEAENDLLKAVSCGFTDKKRLQQQPEFQVLTAAMRAKVESGMNNQ
jgi:hypothetical protein